MGLSEADTRSKLIDPKLIKVGWVKDKIKREVPIIDGKIIDSKWNRNHTRLADYTLYHKGRMIAIVEAKDEGKDHLVGISQAKHDCIMTNTMFAYSSNGHKIEEFDFSTNKQKTIESFPTPDELYKRKKSEIWIRKLIRKSKRYLILLWMRYSKKSFSNEF